MVAETFDESLRLFARRTPFRPFTIELVSGARFEVAHPEALAFNAGVAVHIAPNGKLTLYDHESVSRLIGGADAESQMAS